MIYSQVRGKVSRAVTVNEQAYLESFFAQLEGELKNSYRPGIVTHAPDFIPTILRGDLTLYKMSEHNDLLAEGLRKAGLTN